MLLVNASPVYLKCGMLLRKSQSLLDEIKSLESKFEYINPQLNIMYKSRMLIFLKINYFKISHFQQSVDFQFVNDKISIIKIFDFEDKTSLELKLNNHKDSISILNSPRNKSSKIPICYYCGHLTGKRELLIYELFGKKCIKVGHYNQLAIYGINYITEYIDNSFFDLPNESVGSLIKVGEGLDKVKEKNVLSLKGKLYPYLMANGLEGVSIYRVDSINSFTRLGGNSFGATTLWSLLTLTCGYENPDEALHDATEGDNHLIDLSVGDIYGGNYSQFSLQKDLIASSFGKLKYEKDINKVQKKDIARSLVILYSTSVSQVTSLLSVKSKVDKVILLGSPFDSLELMQMVQVCVGYFSQDKVKGLFSEYSQFLEIIGMCVQLDMENKLDLEYDDEYEDMI